MKKMNFQQERQTVRCGPLACMGTSFDDESSERKSPAVRPSPNDEEQLNSSCRTHECDENFWRLISVWRQIDDRLFERGLGSCDSNADRHILHTQLDCTLSKWDQRTTNRTGLLVYRCPYTKIGRSHSQYSPEQRQCQSQESWARYQIAEEQMTLADRPIDENSRKQRPNLFHME